MQATAKVDEATHLNYVNSDIESDLTVAATYTVIGYFLPLYIERMRRQVNRESIEEGLLVNRYDISVLLTSNILNTALTIKTLLRSARRLWVSAQHPLLTRPSVSR